MTAIKNKKGKIASLEKLAGQVRALAGTPLAEYCRQHKYAPTVGEGSPEARTMLVGEAPGLNEAKSGKSFVEKKE